MIVDSWIISTNKMGANMKLALCVCFFLTMPGYSEQQVLMTIKTITGIAYDVAKLAKLLSGGESSGVTTQDLDKAVESITRNLNNVKKDVLNSILLQSKFDRIDDAVIGIKSSLTDLKILIETNDIETRSKFEEIFIKRYDNDGIQMKIRFLPDILTYEVPGRSGQLLSLLTEDTHCNLTALNEFQVFYLDLLSSGIALETAYLNLKHIQTQKTLEHWEKSSKNIQQAFDNAVNGCTAKFVTLAEKDIADAASPADLWARNNRWFPLKSNDVFFSQALGTFQFIYTAYEQDTMFMTNTSPKKISVFYDNPPERYNLASYTLENATRLLRAVIQGDSDKEAAKHVGIATKDVLSTFGYDVQTLLVIFDTGHFKEIQSKDSPALQAELKDIKMTYSYRIGSRRKRSVINGKFKIYAYIYKEGNTSRKPHKIGCGDSLKSLPFVSLLLVGALTIYQGKIAF